MFRSNGSMIRHPLPSTGSPTERIPLLHGYYGMLRVPAAHPAALRCLRLAVPRLRRPVSCPAITPRPPRRVARAAGLGFAVPVAPFRLLNAEATGVPRFLGNPDVDVPCSSTPTGPAGPGLFSPTDAAFRTRNGVGSRNVKGLSGLYHTAHPLAVYASQPGLLPDHARLASGCWPLCRAGLVTRRVPMQGLASHDAPPCPGFTWRPASGLSGRRQSASK